MLSLGLTNNEMELGFSELFTSYETELQTHGHVQIGNQLGFCEHQFAGMILRNHTYLKVYKCWRILPILKTPTIK